MKKIALIAAVMLVMPSSFAFAEYQSPDDNGVVTLGTTDQLDVRLSSKVQADYNGETNGLAYTISTYHESGTRTFGSSSGDSKIYFMEGTAEACPDAPTSTTDSADFSSWSAL
jgi:hypothetical protein